MYYTIYVELEDGHNMEMFALLESKYHWIARATNGCGFVVEYVFKVSCFRYKAFKHDLNLAIQKGYVKRWFEA